LERRHVDKKQLDEFRIALRHLCDMAALYAAGDRLDSEECAKYISTCSEFLEGLEEERKE
jgi:hypothetical protein